MVIQVAWTLPLFTDNSPPILHPIAHPTHAPGAWYSGESVYCHRTLFLLIFFVHFWSNFTSHSLPHVSSLCLSLLGSFFYVSHTHKQMTRTQFDWYNRSPNTSSTGLPTSWNSPVVVPPQPDPVLEPPLPPPNTPTTQSSGLPSVEINSQLSEIRWFPMRLTAFLYRVSGFSIPSWLTCWVCERPAMLSDTFQRAEDFEQLVPWTTSLE